MTHYQRLARACKEGAAAIILSTGESGSVVHRATLAAAAAAAAGRHGLSPQPMPR